MSVQYIIITNHSAGHIVGYEEISVSLPFSSIILFKVKLGVTELGPKLLNHTTLLSQVLHRFNPWIILFGVILGFFTFIIYFIFFYFGKL